ncbi:hypothetical protein BGX31_002499 [Mortierella sp. GBA43]|nr:hypothetical protein BGX31_002499 [Mortierella sp. GBA43]
MKTTTSGRAFAKGIFDVFSTLMISLRIDNHKVRFKSYPNSFTAEAAVSNLGNLQVIQSNRIADPNDPTRVISHVTTTQFSLSRDMARNLCQTFMDASLIESATDPTKREFQTRGLYQVTPKGAHLLAKFVVRNSLAIEEHRHITSNAAASLVYLERTDDEDAIIFNLKQVEMIFKRFAGPEPNVSKAIPTEAPASPPSSSGRERVSSVMDRGSGIEVKDRQYDNEIYRHTFFGKAAVEWLMDYTAVISKEEAICICQEMVNARYIEQIGEENWVGPSLFKTGNFALYHLTETGRAIAGWQSLDDSSASDDWMDERTSIGAKVERSIPEPNPLSVQFKLAAANIARLPISFANEERRSIDEASLAGTSYDDNRASARRLSQILNDPALQMNLPEGAMTSYTPSSSGLESIGTSTATGGARLSPPTSSLQSTTSNASRLHGILSDTTVRDLFKNFLKQHFCAENLSFHLEVVDYKTKFTTLIATAKAYNISPAGQEPNGINVPYPPSLRELEKQICNQAFAIYELYLVSGAPREVNLPHQMRYDIMAYMQGVVRNMETSESNNISANTDNRNLSSTTTTTTPSSPPFTSYNDSSNGDKANGNQKELIHISLFDLIHAHTFRLMSTDSVPKFIRTEKYLEVVMSKHRRMNTASSVSIPVGSFSSINGTTTGSPTTGQEPMSGFVNGTGANRGMATSNSNPGSPPNSGYSRNEDGSNLRRSHSLSRARYETTDAVMNSNSLAANSNGGAPMEGRSRSAGVGLIPARYSSFPINSSVGTPVNPNTQQLRAPRTRSVSSNGAVDGNRGAQQQFYSHPPSPSGANPGSPAGSNMNNKGSNNTNARNGQTPRYGSGVPRQSAASASLMDIYTHQQHLQQYSNQRAQMSPAQVQQMFIMRNSRSVPTLGSSSSSPSSSINTAAASGNNTDQTRIRQHSHPVSGTIISTATSQEYGSKPRDDDHITTSPQQMSPAEKLSTDRVMVLFESTSFFIQEPNVSAPSSPSAPIPLSHHVPLMESPPIIQSPDLKVNGNGYFSGGFPGNGHGANGSQVKSAMHMDGGVGPRPPLIPLKEM